MMKFSFEIEYNIISVVMITGIHIISLPHYVVGT